MHSRGKFGWIDYASEHHETVESWMDEEAKQFTGCDEGFEKYYKYWVNEADTKPGENFWAKVILLDGAPVGVIAIGLWDGVFTISEFVIRPESRGTGIGSSALTELLTFSEDIIGIRIENALAVIFPNNTASQKAFEKAGFVFYSEHSDGDAWNYRYHRSAATHAVEISKRELVRMQNYRNGKWASKIISMQHSDGGWGCFHTLRAGSDTPMTTETALLRLELLGYTAEDECIKKAIAHMEMLLHTGELPEGNEKTSDFETFVKLIAAARIRRLTDRCESANEIADKWANIITEAFGTGVYSQTDYDSCYKQVIGRKPKGGRLCDFVNYYTLSLLRGMLDEQTESRMLDYILEHDGGIYYVYESRLDTVPEIFQSKTASRYLAAIELLINYKSSQDKLSFVFDWLRANRHPDGTWDMGAAAKDGVYFPLSDRWNEKSRIKDSTYRIGRLFCGRIGTTSRESM